MSNADDCLFLFLTSDFLGSLLNSCQYICATLKYRYAWFVEDAQLSRKIIFERVSFPFLYFRMIEFISQYLQTDLVHDFLLSNALVLYC